MSDETTYGDASQDDDAQDDDAQDDDAQDDDGEPTFEERLEESQLDEARDVLNETNRRLMDVPAEVVVTNHAMGLYQLAAIHLGAAPPNLPEAALAIDAVACLVEGLGDRLGPESATMRDALANIRLAFVQIKGSVGTVSD